MPSVVFILFLIVGAVAEASPCIGNSENTRAPFGTVIPHNNKVMFTQGKSKNEAFNSGDSFEMLVWNVKKHEEAGFWVDFPRLAQQREFVLIQEDVVDDYTQHTYRNRFPNLRWDTAISFISKNLVPTGVSTGSTRTPSEYCFLRSEPREPIIATPKMALISKYPVAGSDDLLIVNLHGINFVLDYSFHTQMVQIFNSIKNHRGPMIVAGDFNTRGRQRFQTLQFFQRGLDLQHISLSNDTRKLHFDHILSRGLKVHWARVLNSIESSDHYPLEAKFQIP